MLKLQMRATDVVYAYKQVRSVVSTLKGMRQDSAREFKQVFIQTTKLGQDLHGDQFQLCKPRVTRHQVHRSNPETSSAEDHFRITLYNEFLSHVVAELDERFVNNPAHEIALGLLYLLPMCSEVESEDGIPKELSEAVDLYKDDLPHPVMVPTEYRMWIRKWKGHEEQSAIPGKLVDALQACSAVQFPNLHILLRIALTLPITTCESERSFSQLKLTKTSNRSSMTDKRVSGLALMRINHDRYNKMTSPETMKDLIRSFAQLHPRRMKLSFMLAD